MFSRWDRCAIWRAPTRPDGPCAPPRIARRSPSATALKVSGAVGLVVSLTLGAGTAQTPSADSPQRVMSVHNRLLLNRLAVSGFRTLQVLLMVRGNRFGDASAAVERLGGRIRQSDVAIGYLRAELPLERLMELVEDPSIEAYQVSSLSRASWYRDGPPQANAELFRRIEFTPMVPAAAATERSSLPPLSPEVAAQAGYTADDDVGVREWLSEHPTFDGRAVTIAFLESAQPEFSHPTLQHAKALDGADIPKIVGILNAIAPDDPDDTRVDLATEVHASSTWRSIAGRTYVLPRRGLYRFGLFTLVAGTNLVQQFGVLQDQDNAEIRVDTDGDGDFREERPVIDVNEQFDVRTLGLTHPRQIDLAFVISKGRGPNQVHIYTAQAGHTAMTTSVAAGGRTPDGLASGVAPGARALLVRNSSHEYTLHNVFEGYLDAIKRPDVDILNDSAGISMVPDTEREFSGIFFRRLIAQYRKPIVHGAGNTQQFLNNVSALSDVFAVGGSISNVTLAALYGSGPIAGPMVHPVSAAGPALDGALKPDFIAPVHRIAADVWFHDSDTPLPRRAPTSRLPSGYRISCCTSASSPYAAGVLALLISAAKQQGVPYSVETLGRALRVSARFLPTAQAHQQGNGLLNLQAAWRELQRRVEAPTITMTAANVHALARYAASGRSGVGLFEREGWHAKSSGRRDLGLTRESGPPDPVTYRVSWTGNDGSFSTASSIRLPFGKQVFLPLTVSLRTPGVHSAIVNLHDSRTNAVVFRAAATIVASERFDPPDRTVRFAGALTTMRTEAHFVSVPEHAAALSVELEVLRGSVTATLLPNHGLHRPYYEHLFPTAGRTFAPGKYRVVVAQPPPGTWSLSMSNDSAWRGGPEASGTSEEAAYSVTFQILRASITSRPMAGSQIAVDAINQGAELRDPVFETSIGTLTSHRGALSTNGLPAQIEIEVPPGAATLSLHLRRADPGGPALELYLYDCTSGECFSYDFTVPAAAEQTMVVRQPAGGRWVAAVNAAPFPVEPGSFVLDEVITGPPRRHRPASSVRRAFATQWTETLDVRHTETDAASGSRVLSCELIDAAIERDGKIHAWENRAGLPNLAERSIAIGTALTRQH